MDCNKWQEEGLLYVSHEMGVKQAEEYGKHIQECKACNDEIDTYFQDKKAYFSADILLETTSQALDNKIIAACSSLPKASQGFSLFSGVWFKRALISSVFLIFGTGAGVYFTMNYYNSLGGASVVASNKTVKSAAVSVASVSKNQNAMPALTKDSLKQKPVDPFDQRIRPIGSSQGIITVDLKKE